ncbi:hypothetical protein TIFTF001_027859 [Ficus carica]|uniref:Gag protein n=1 Tax=Ficus carica TaxID=3494 RepID=A0AA88DNU2_FICCA|nr:hypothetical protein TIFTF001_027859 [Ficus carica]
MVRPRTRANQNSQEPDLANVEATLQRQLMEQQRETNRLREQIARLDQIPQANVVPPQENPVPPVVPQVPEVHHEIPRNAEIPLPPVGVQANIPLFREDLLYERFRRTKEQVLCAFCALKKDARHWKILAAQEDEFNSFRQGSMTVLEAVKKFELLARLCPELVPNEIEKVRRMMNMFRTDIAKEARAQNFKAKKEEKVVVKQSQPQQNQDSLLKGQSSNADQNLRQFGKNKRRGNTMG